MNKIQDKIIKNFLTEWEDKNYYLGAILTGSYATGTESKHSDIDLLLVLSKSTKWKKRGNKMINGILLEYIAYPADEWIKLLNLENNNGTRMWSVMWSVGKIINDKSSTVIKIIGLAKKIRLNPVKKITGNDLEMAKYHLFDGLENLKDLHAEKDPAFLPTYFFHLSKLITSYANYLGVSLPATAKLSKFFLNKKYRQAYKLQRFPDEMFVNKTLKCMKNTNISAIEALSRYTIDKMEGFNIDGWSIKTNR